MASSLTIRPVIPADRPQLRAAIIELQDFECRLHSTRLPGYQIADAYLGWIEAETAASGAILVAELSGDFAGFVSDWVHQDDAVAETADSKRFDYISDVCVMPVFRGRRIAGQLLHAIEAHLAGFGITRIRVASLAMNTSARRCYEHTGFSAYEVMHEKVIAT